MKKNKNIILVSVSFAFVFTFLACHTGIYNTKIEINTQKEFEEDVKTGSAAFSVVIPDYYAMAGLNNNARAIAPQTERIQFSYKDKNSTEWIIHSTKELSNLEKTAIPNAPEDFVGSVYKCSFEKIPSGNYDSETMRIEFLDSMNNVISSGTNNSTVTIKPDKNTQTTFYTIPTSSDANEGTLAAGEMKFLKKVFDSRQDITLTVSVPNGNTYPDLVIFNSNGMFEQYIHLTEGNNEIVFSGFYTKYLGFWSETATSYSTSTRFTSPTDEDETAFSNILNNPDWKSVIQNFYEGSFENITEENGVISFSGNNYYGNLKRTIVLNQPKIFSFKIRAGVAGNNDSSLQFLIDGIVMNTYAIRDGVWVVWNDAWFEIESGVHTIEWEIVAKNSYYSYADIKDFVLEDIVEPELSSLDIPVATYTKEECTTTATITGQNFDKPYIDLSDFSATCLENPDIVSDAIFKIKNNTVLEVSFNIPPATGEYNITINYKTNSITGVLKVIPTNEDTYTFRRRNNWFYSSSISINEENGVITFNGTSNSEIIKRSVVLNQSKILSFKVETNIYDSLQFLIDDVVKAKYKGKNSVWENEIFEIEEGIHTIEWRRDTPTGTAHVTNIVFGEPIQAIESINQDFESELDTNMYIGGGLSASVVSDDNTTHGKVYKLGVYKDSKSSNSSLRIYKITLVQEKTLSFDYSCDLVYNANNGTIKDYLRVYIDNSETPVFEATGPKGWKTGVITIPTGTHSVRFSAEKTYDADGTSWRNSGANAVFLDNIKLESSM